MFEYDIRPASRNDFKEIRSLIHAVRINPTGLDWRHFLVATAPSGKLLGCGQIKTHTDGSHELASIAVRETARGRGIAREIIEALLARETARPLYLMCREGLELLYTKFGFQVITTDEMPPYFRRISHLVMTFQTNSLPGNRLIIMRLVR